MEYPIYKLAKNGNLILWDGPSLCKADAEELLRCRQHDYPKEKFFIVKMKES